MGSIQETNGKSSMGETRQQRQSSRRDVPINKERPAVWRAPLSVCLSMEANPQIGSHHPSAVVTLLPEFVVC